jgi:hypothetical protein
MPARQKTTRIQQLHLFRSLPNTPHWQSLSTEIRGKTLMLLARMLRRSYPARLTPVRGAEVRDE